MDSEERNSVLRGLNLLKPYLTAFVTQHARRAKSAGAMDTQALLSTILDEWDSTFQGLMPRVARAYVHELRDVRNRWAHEVAFTRAETARALDTMGQIAAVIGAPFDPAPSARKRRASSARSRIARPVISAGQKWSGQRETMRLIFSRWKNDTERVIREYAAAERAGKVQRKANKSGRSPEEYARALLADGLKKGWLE